jgi:hypothetical protein
MKFTPADKGGTSPILPAAGVVCASVGGFVLSVAFIREGGYWLLFITLPFSVLLFWLSKCFIGSFLNASFSTTQVEIGDTHLSVRNSPFGRSFTLPLAEIRDAVITDILSPQVAMELLLTSKDLKTFQILSCRRPNEHMRTIVQRLRK